MLKRIVDVLRPGSNRCTDVCVSLGLSSHSVIYKRKELRIATLATTETGQYSCVDGSTFFYYVMS